MIYIILVLALSTTACTTITYQDGQSKFTRTSIGTQLQMTELRASVDGKGNRKIILQGYVSDQVQAMEKIAEGAARGAASALKP